MQEWL